MSRFVLFAQGLRPFFLLAGLDALFNIALWLCVYFHPALWPADALPSPYWHGHEMIFGFIAAAIAGFLLTAVPGWTGRSSYAGAPLIALAALWLLGRIAFLPFAGVGKIAAGAVDLAFFPALALTLAPTLIKARKLRNLPFLVLLTALFIANLLFYLGWTDVLPGGELTGLMLAVDVILLLVTIVGGRIIPAFTRSGLKLRGSAVEIGANPWVEGAVIAAMLAVLVGDLVAPMSEANGIVAFIAALAQFVRWAQWKGRHTLGEPLIWVLHLGYAWIVVGLALKGCLFLFQAAFAAKWLHAFTIGAFSTMVLAVMTRASLGHTGRALLAPKPMTAAYLLLTLAALVRVFGPAVAPQYYDTTIALTGAAWLLAFVLFVIVYGPILTRPRADGRPG